jgi:hypothetical protein
VNFFSPELIIAVCTDKPDLMVPGKWVKCRECILMVFLSDSTVKNIEQHGYFKEDIVVECMSCAFKRASAQLSPPSFLELSDEQKSEIRTGLQNLRKRK